MATALQPGLAAASGAGSRPARGKLKIFFGMAPGVGKTRAMLAAAQQERLAGRDVVLVCLQDPGLAQRGLTKGLRTLAANRPVNAVEAPDLDALLNQRPDIAVVDSLAWDNAPGCRHPKRYLDVLQMLEAGLDVFTTLNVGQVAGWSDPVRRLVGTAPGSLVPDAILEVAELELVDLAPRELLRRIRRAEVRFDAEAGAPSGFRDEGRLVLLRELALRFFAQRIAQEARGLLQGPVGFQLQQRFLVLVRQDCDNEPVVRWACRLARGFHADWIVLFVEPLAPVRQPHQARILQTLSLARELGAEVVTTSHKDPVAAALRLAAQRSVTQLVVGKPMEPAEPRLLQREALVPSLLKRSKDLGVHLVPLESSPAVVGPAPLRRMTAGFVGQYALALAVIILVTLAGFLLTPVVGAHATALVYLLTVVGLALLVPRGPTLAAAALSALFWDYFFLPPIFAFQITHFEDAMLFGMYFVVALVLGHLTARIRAQESAEREGETRATALYLLTRDLNESVDLEQMVQRVVQQLGACFRAKVAVLLPQGDGALRACTGSTLEIPPDEQALPDWVLQHRQRAGRLTSNSPRAGALYLPLIAGGGPLGVLGLKFNQLAGWSLHQENLIDAVAQQLAMALDRHRLNTISEKAKLLAQSERLSKTLLDSMSHEVRTPIAVIKSATGNLAQLQDGDEPMRAAMISEIQEATDRLNHLVGNILEASRLESGAVKPRINECDVSELIHVVLEAAEKDLALHPLTVEIQPRLPVVPMDFVLMQQALANLLSNSALHTPAGTPIELNARLEDDSLVLTVADRGPGIPADSLPRIFDKFYRVPNSRPGGTGLGLSLVKGFVEAQGGKVVAKNRPGGGTWFEIRIPRIRPGVDTEDPDLQTEP